MIVSRNLGGAIENLFIRPAMASGEPRLTQTEQRSAAGTLLGLRVGNDGTALSFGAGRSDLSSVGRVVVAPEAGPAWSLETASYSVAWPQDWGVYSTDPGSVWPFELHGVRELSEAMIMLRGPLHGRREVPAPPQLIGRGQQVIADDLNGPAPWLELGYTHAGKEWRQRHFYGRLAPETVVLVTAQAPQPQAARVFADAEAMTRSIRPLGN